MIRRALVSLFAGTAMLALPLSAHGQSYGQQPAASPTAPAAPDNATQKTDTKSGKAIDDDDTSGGTVIRAGPNAGMVIDRRHHSKPAAADASKAPSKDNQCQQPCV